MYLYKEKKERYLPKKSTWREAFKMLKKVFGILVATDAILIHQNTGVSKSEFEYRGASVFKQGWGVSVSEHRITTCICLFSVNSIDWPIHRSFPFRRTHNHFRRVATLRRGRREKLGRGWRQLWPWGRS